MVFATGRRIQVDIRTPGNTSLHLPLSDSHYIFFVYSELPLVATRVVLVCECKHTLNKLQTTQNHHQALQIEEGETTIFSAGFLDKPA